MDIKRKLNEEGSYDYTFIKGNIILRIYFAGNLDLYLTLSDGNLIKYNTNKELIFDITKENYEVYKIIDELYSNVLNNDPYFDGNKENFYEYVHNDLVINNNIVWYSDDEPIECADKFTLTKVDDTYRFIFNRVDKDYSYFKSSSSISVRLRNSGSRYEPFNCSFMIMYRKLQSVDPNYHQIRLEELNYKKRSLQK